MDVQVRIYIEPAVRGVAGVGVERTGSFEWSVEGRRAMPKPQYCAS
jgi:hypothetical protein